MGYELKFLSGSLDAVKAALRGSGANPPAKLRQAWDGLYDPDGGEKPGKALAKGLAEVASVLDAGKKARPSLLGQLTLVAAIESTAQPLGSLEHSSSGGDEFRDDFLGGLAAGCYQEPALAKLLTSRPIFGLEPDGYPGWGYLTGDELARLLAARIPPETKPVGDQSRWLADLDTLLKRASAAKQDLLTLYR